jgi:hypothetical protein
VGTVRRLIPGAVLVLVPFAALSLVATGGWLLALRRTARDAAPSRAGFGFVLAVALAARALLLLPAEPLSDDLYRYLWDGRVANAGINPFRYPPTAPELEPLRDELLWPRINHPDIPTIYPPVAQALFAGLDRAAPHPLGARAAAAAADLVAVLGLALLLRARGRSPALALVHGWCPLAVLETAGGGHVDALGVTLLVAAFVLLERAGRPSTLAGGGLLGMSILVKPMGAFLAPALLRSRSGRSRLLLVGGGLLSLIWLAPYLDAGPRLFTGFLAYAERWHFNDSFYTLAVIVGIPPGAVRVGLAAVLLAAAFWIPWRWRDPLASAGCVLGSVLALSPTVHPWYALWRMPFVPFLPRSVAPAAITLLALLPMAYFTAWSRTQTGVWDEPVWTRAALWIPVLGLLALAAFRSRAAARNQE